MRAPVLTESDGDLLSTTTIEHPHDFYKRLNLHKPLARIGDTGVHMVSSWALIDDVLHREQDFSANLTGVLVVDEQGVPAAFDLPPSDGTRVIATADNPRHEVHRRLLQAYFTPSAVSQFEPFVTSAVNTELASVVSSGGGDLVPVCERVPALVVARLLGLPEEDVEHFRTWAMMGGDMLAGIVSADTMGFLAAETARMSDYIGRYLDDAPALNSVHVTVPLLSVLKDSVGRGDVTRGEALGIAIVLFGAGGESTAALMASSIKRLAEDDDLSNTLRKTPSLIPRFVEEIVRLETPFKFHYRAVRTDCNLAGFDLQHGDRLMLMWAAANRDPASLKLPEQLQLDRKHPKTHMGFGRGLHFCIGAVLARLEARLLIEHLLASSKQLVLEDHGWQYAPSIFIRRLEKLRIGL
ncbi:MAG: cytochrome P450 [Pseudomonadota bacterium]